MRLAILADIHGNLPALEAVLADAHTQGVDGFVVAGDLLLGGPFPTQTLARLRDLDAWMIQGNNEGYFRDYNAGTAPVDWQTNMQWAILRWCYAQLDREALDFLLSLPDRLEVALPGCDPLCVVHGSPRNVSEGILPPDPEVMHKFARAMTVAPLELEAALKLVSAPVLICAHTHIAWQHRSDSRLALNPGSVGGPVDGVVGAEYALLTWEGTRWTVDLRVVPYDVDALRAAYRCHGLLDGSCSFARAFLRGHETGQNFSWYFVLHAYTLTERAGLPDCDAIPDEIWERADATFDWQTGLIDLPEKFKGRIFQMKGVTYR